MKVLEIVNMYPSEKDSVFGIFVKKTLDPLRKEGIETEIVANYIKKAGLFFTPYKYGLLKLKVISKAFSSYDIIHAHYAFIPVLLGSYLKKLKKVPLILTCYGSDINILPNKNSITRNIVKNGLKNSDKIICVSNALKEKVIKEFEINEEKIEVIPFGVDENFKSINQDIARKKLGIKTNKKIVLYVGNLVEVKNPKIFIQLAEKLTDREFILVGDGELKDYLLNQIKEKNIKNIKLVGKKPYEDIPLWLNASDLFILPSFNEGTPNAILEAMACKIPVIASNVGGIPELIKKDYLFEPDNCNQIIDLIKKLDNKKIKDNTIEENFNNITKNYKMETVTKKLVKVYNEVYTK